MLLCCQGLLKVVVRKEAYQDGIILPLPLAPGHGRALYKEDFRTKHRVDGIQYLCLSLMV